MSLPKDALLVLSSFPDPTPDSAIHQAAILSSRWSTNLSAVVVTMQTRNGFLLGERLADVPDMMERALATSMTNTAKVKERFESIARQCGVYGRTIEECAPLYAGADQINRHARLHDLLYMPVSDTIILDELQMAAVIFGAGRPVILVPATTKASPNSVTAETVVVAWDFSRAAARALADAMPLLNLAKQVHFVTVTNEKKLEDRLPSSDLERHMKMHGVSASWDEIEAGGRDIGFVLNEYVTAKSADLLVMGAFGHSRMLEFVLGGATRSILRNPLIPVFLSH